MMRLIYPICCGLDVHKKVIVATIVTTNSSGISEYHQKSFTTIIRRILIFRNFRAGYLKTSANMSAWNPPVSIGFLFLIILNMTWMCVSLLPNMSNPSKVRKQSSKKTCISMCPPGISLMVQNPCVHGVVNPTDDTDLMNLHLSQPKVKLNDTNVFAYLKEQGYDSSSFVKCNDN